MTGIETLPNQDMTSKEIHCQINLGDPNTINKDIIKVVGTMELHEITHHSKITVLQDKETECQ